MITPSYLTCAKSRTLFSRRFASRGVPLDLLDVDKFGLDHIDRNILITMIEKFQGGPVGLETLAASISEDAGTLEDVYEPYLLKNGFIQRTPRGRVVTELAYQHLGIPREV